MIRSLPIAFIALFLLLSWSNPPIAHGKVVDRIAAVVNDKVITLSEVMEKAQPILEKMESRGQALSPLERQQVVTKVLGQLIDEQLVEMEAKKLHIQVTDQEVESAYKRILQENNLSEEEFREKLAKSGMTLPEYKEELRRQIRQSRLVHSQVNAKIAVTDEEVLEYAKKNGLLGQSQGPVFSLQHICIPYGQGLTKEEARRLAEEALAKIKKGTPFEEVAANYSKVPSSQEGGFLGTFTLKEMAPFVRDVVTRLKVGEVSQVVDTPIGFQIFRLKGISQAEKGGLAKGISEEIRRRLYRQKIEQQFQRWLVKLRQKYTIKILL